MYPLLQFLPWTDYSPEEGYTDVYFRRSIDCPVIPGGVTVKHFFSSDDLKDIESYADLQRLSASHGSIQGENPLLHIREKIPGGKYHDPPNLDRPCVAGEAFFHEADSYSKYINADIGTYFRQDGDVLYVVVIRHGSAYSDRWYLKIQAIAYADWTCVLYPDYSPDRIYIYGHDSSYETPEWIRVPHSDSHIDTLSVFGDVISVCCETALMQARSQPRRREITVGLPVKFNPDYPSSRFYVAGVTPTDLSKFDPYMDHIELRSHHKSPVGLWSSLTAEAISKTSFDSNTIANGLELVDLANSIRTGRLISDIIKKGKIFESSKNAWLAYRYSYSTTLADYEELTEFIEDCNSTIVRSGNSFGSLGTAHLKMKIAPPQSKIKAVVDELTKYGVAPNLYNLWDLVPFSFVADWFIGLGDVLESVTQYGRVNAYDIRYVTTSWTWSDKVERDGVTATLDYYERNVSPTAPAYVPYVEQPGPSGKTVMKRVIDGVCLFT